jgi:5-methyltetrahydropteroyltriglutamate--homocysteine methyltransferase
MKRSDTRILTTHVGSIIRPASLTELSNVRIGAPKNPAEYNRRVADAVTEVVRHQVAIGLDIVNDGEFGKTDWTAYILGRITGFEHRADQKREADWAGHDRFRFAEFLEAQYPFMMGGLPTDACIGPIAYRDHDPLDRAIANLTAAVKQHPPLETFMTAVAPASTAYDGINEYYPNERDYVFAIADALREEYLAIHRAGFILQVDDAVLANMYDHLVSQSPERYREWAELRIEALNHALRGIPKDRIRYHVCFGSWHAPHMSDAPLENIVDIILQADVGAISMEAANPRHEHEWRAWADAKRRGMLPKDLIMIPGVVTHHTVTVEHPRVVADRILRYTDIFDRENVIAGTDCGFAQMDVIQRVQAEIMWAKYEVLVEGARIASAELWDQPITRETALAD